MPFSASLKTMFLVSTKTYLLPDTKLSHMHSLTYFFFHSFSKLSSYGLEIIMIGSRSKRVIPKKWHYEEYDVDNKTHFNKIISDINGKTKILKSEHKVACTREI